MAGLDKIVASLQAKKQDSEGGKAKLKEKEEAGLRVRMSVLEQRDSELKEKNSEDEVKSRYNS